ncbi:MAG: Hsp20/alpha crystallin family protein [Desulfurivibrionaceae bacterium]
MITRNFFNFPNPAWRGTFDELDRIKGQLDRLMGGLDRGVSRFPGRGVFPLLNLSEDKDNYYIRGEIPGVSSKNLEINATDDNISISGERTLKEEDKNATFHRRERDAGRFSRALTIPGKINNEKIEAKIVDGVLEIIAPKAEETKPKQIKIK